MRKTFTILLLIAATLTLHAQDTGPLNKLADDEKDHARVLHAILADHRLWAKPPESERFNMVE